MGILIFVLGIGVMIAIFLTPVIKLLFCLNTILERWDTYTEDEKMKVLNALHDATITSERSRKKNRSMYRSYMRTRKRPTRIKH